MWFVIPSIDDDGLDCDGEMYIHSLFWPARSSRDDHVNGSCASGPCTAAVCFATLPTMLFPFITNLNSTYIHPCHHRNSKIARRMDRAKEWAGYVQRYSPCAGDR